MADLSTIDQTWDIDGGLITLLVRCGRPLPASFYTAVQDVITGLERLAAAFPAPEQAAASEVLGSTQAKDESRGNP